MINERTIMIGKIPLYDLCNNLNSRAYNKELAIEYIKRTYDIDVTNLLNTYYFDYKTNVFDKYDKDYPLSRPDDGTREFFTSIGRNRYLKFHSHYIESDGDYCEIIDFSSLARTVHHIFPLVYGGKNNIQNLILVSDTIHDILHSNPLEYIEKYCFQAVDYFKYLFKGGFKEVVDEYNLVRFKDSDPRTQARVAFEAVRDKMQRFYDYLCEQESEKGCVCG